MILLLFYSSASIAPTANTTLYTSFLREVLPYVHDCPELVALNAIRNAAIEFCEKTDYVMYDPLAIQLVGGVGEYTPAMPSETRIGRVEWAFVDNAALRPITESQAKRLYGIDWRTLVGNAYYYMADTTFNTVRLIPAPPSNTTSELDLRVASVPTRDSTAVNSDVYQRYLEEIAWGARARLNETVGQPYYDPAAAMVLRTKFMTAISAAKLEKNRNMTGASLTMVPGGRLWSRTRGTL